MVSDRIRMVMMVAQADRRCAWIRHAQLPYTTTIRLVAAVAAVAAVEQNHAMLPMRIVGLFKNPRAVVAAVGKALRLHLVGA